MPTITKFLCSLSFVLFSIGLQAQCNDYPFAREGVGDERNEGHGVAVDPFGNVFLGGWFDSDSIIFDGGSAPNSSIGQNGNGDVFIARYHPDGSLDWVTSAGGFDNSDWCWDIAAGPDGSVFGTGYFFSNTMEFGGGVSINKVGLTDAWIAKWDSTGTCLWARAFGAGDSEEAWGIDVDAAGNSYITGAFGQTIVHGSSTLVETAGDDLYVAVYDPNGTPLWAVSAGGTSFDGGYDVAVGDDGRIYVAGRTFGDFDFAGSTWTNQGLGDLLLLAFEPDGTEDWMLAAGGDSNEELWDLDVHPDGSIIFGGSHWSTPLNVGGTNVTSDGQWDVLVGRVSADGTLQWVQSPGGGGTDKLYGIAVAPDGTIYGGGQWGSSSGSIGSFSLTETGIFTAVWDDAGNALAAESFGGVLTQFDIIWDADAGPNGGYYGGEFTTASIDFGGGEIINNGPGGTFDSDVFVVAQRSPAGITVNQPLEDDTLCEGENLILTIDPTALAVQWYKDGVLIPGATMESLDLGAVALADAGGYYAWLGDGCDSATTDTANLIILEFPADPVLTLSADGDSIFASHSGDELVWAIDGVVATGLSGDTIFPTVEGVYTAVALNSLGDFSCASGLSNEIQISFSTAVSEPGLVLHAWPNPVTAGAVNVQISGGEARLWNLCDMTGRQLLSGRLEAGNFSEFLILDGLNPGLYLLEVDGFLPKRLIVH